MGEQHQSKVLELWMYLNNPVDLYSCNVKQFNALSPPNSITKSCTFKHMYDW